MERALKEQKTIVEKLKEAHELLEKEKSDVRAMHNHSVGDLGDHTATADSDVSIFANPLIEDEDSEE